MEPRYEICTARRLSGQRKRALFYLGLIVGIIVAALTLMPGLSTEFGVFDQSVTLSRISIRASVWRYALWPESSFIGEAQDFAIEVINLAVRNGILASSRYGGRRFAAICLLLSCAFIFSVCALISFAAASFLGFLLVYLLFLFVYRAFLLCPQLSSWVTSSLGNIMTVSSRRKTVHKSKKISSSTLVY